jgi:antitoxin ParD1/3/4
MGIQVYELYVTRGHTGCFENIPIVGILVKISSMAKNTSILLGDYFEEFINHQVQSGKFASASEVVRAALRVFEQEEKLKAELVGELKKGEKSGFVEAFDRQTFVKNLHTKYANNDL